MMDASPRPAKRRFMVVAANGRFDLLHHADSYDIAPPLASRLL